jgi:hypothetical protein
MRCHCASAGCRKYIGGAGQTAEKDLPAPEPDEAAPLDLPPIMLGDGDLDPNMRMLLDWRVGSRVDKARELGMVTRCVVRSCGAAAGWRAHGPPCLMPAKLSHVDTPFLCSLERLCKSRQVQWTIKHFFGQAPLPDKVEDEAAVIAKPAVVEPVAAAEGPANGRAQPAAGRGKGAKSKAAAGAKAGKGKAAHADGEAAAPTASAEGDGKAGGEVPQVRGPKAAFKAWKIAQQQGKGAAMKAGKAVLARRRGGQAGVHKCHWARRAGGSVLEPVAAE